MKVINFYLSHMVEVIGHYHGTIDEFMGDGILVFFGAPMERKDDAARAVACAISMQTAMKTVNAQMAAWNLPQLSMGIGINTGEVVVGNIGSEKRAKYGVVGNQVNLTFRIESYTIGDQILISEATRQEVLPILEIKRLRQLRMKGISDAITVYEVAGITGKYDLWMQEEDEDDELLPLKEPIPIQGELLEGKELINISLTGSLVQLSGKGAIVQFERWQNSCIPEVLSNFRFYCLGAHDFLSSHTENYAKVVDVNLEEQSCHIYFTNMFFQTEPNLKNLYHLLKHSR